MTAPRLCYLPRGRVPTCQARFEVPTVPKGSERADREVAEAALAAAAGWCRRAARTAHRMRLAGDLGTDTKSDRFDLVTHADHAVESYIRRAIQRRFPDHGIVGEEYGSVRNESVWLWLVDPIDGTFNFATDLAPCATTIGLLHRSRPRVGVVAEIGTGRVLAAQTGSPLSQVGARARLGAATIGHDGSARLFLEFGAERLDDWMLAGLQAMSRTRDLVPRLIGSAAVALAAVAHHGGCFVGVGLKAWDVAGGICLTEAAGYKTRWWDDAFPGVHVLVGEPEVVRDLEPAVADLVSRWRVEASRVSP